MSRFDKNTQSQINLSTAVELHIIIMIIILVILFCPAAYIKTRTRKQGDWMRYLIFKWLKTFNYKCVHSTPMHNLHEQKAQLLLLHGSYGAPCSWSPDSYIDGQVFCQLILYGRNITLQIVVESIYRHSKNFYYVA